MRIYRVGSLISQSADDDARLIQDAKGEDVAEVEIERHDNAGIGQGTIDEHPVGGTFQPQRPDVHRFVAELFQEIDGLWRDTGVGQKPWVSGADWVDFVLASWERSSAAQARVVTRNRYR